MSFDHLSCEVAVTGLSRLHRLFCVCLFTRRDLATSILIVCHGVARSSLWLAFSVAIWRCVHCCEAMVDSIISMCRCFSTLKLSWIYLVAMERQVATCPWTPAGDVLCNFSTSLILILINGSHIIVARRECFVL